MSAEAERMRLIVARNRDFLSELEPAPDDASARVKAESNIRIAERRLSVAAERLARTEPDWRVHRCQNCVHEDHL